MVEELVIDAKDSVLGRVASFAAKKALLGEKIVIVNAEKAYVSGSRDDILAQHLHLRLEVGQIRQGPYFHTKPDRYVKRVIRGMLPHKNPQGRAIYNSVRCYSGIPEAYANHKLVSVKPAHVSKLPTLRRMSVKDICMAVGGSQ